jgi:hypothetical protein
MKRRINYTGRKGIPVENIAIRLEEHGPGEPRTFSANLSKLAELGLDKTGHVYVEPYVRSSSMRLSFGTVGAIVSPADTKLSEIDSGGSVLFRVKVVDESTEVGKILAAANHIRPVDETDEQDDEKAILPLRLRDLGEAIWLVDVDGQARPELVLNNRIPLLAERLKSDPLIQGIVIPHAMKAVMCACMADEVDESLEWVRDWRKFIAALLGEELEEGLEQDDLEVRVAAAVDKFIARMKFTTRAVEKMSTPTGLSSD